MTGSADIHQALQVSDLQVNPVSDALSNWKLDVVISGSIGAVESVKFIRSLRRLGCDVTPWLTRGGAEFITAQSLAWAAGREATTSFSGAATHIAVGSGCIVAPASASLIAKIAHGVTDSPASALIASYLGQKKPVLLLPNMHDSLYASPAVANNLQSLSSYGVTVLDARREEGKQKFPSPDELADVCSHKLLSRENQRGRVIVTMGTTRGYIDDVRYVSNYSSGALGTAVSRELYRQGFETVVVCGPCPIKPSLATQIIDVQTNDEMAKAIESNSDPKLAAAVLAASVLDFVPESKASGKIKSSDNERLTVNLVRTKKIIASVNAKVKVGFKLESGLTEAKAGQLAAEYMEKYNLSLFVINDLNDVSATKHRAKVFDRKSDSKTVNSKEDVAHAICRHIIDNSGA